MNKNDILMAANLLFNHRLNKTGLKSLPASCIPKSIEDAYLIQEQLMILYLTLSNNNILGKKAGCTNLHALNK